MKEIRVQDAVGHAIGTRYCTHRYRRSERYTLPAVGHVITEADVLQITRSW